MALVTPLRDYSVIDEIRSLHGRSKLDRAGWDRIKSVFISYVLDEDKKYFTNPGLDQYRGQQLLRDELNKSWIATTIK